MKKTTATLLVSAAAMAAFADTATNSVIAVPVQKPKPTWDSSIALGLTITKGNSDTTLFTGAILTDKKTDANEYSFGLDGTYGKNDGVENNELLHGFGQWNHLFSEKFFDYVRVDGTHDGIADIKYRFTIGPGAGYYFIKDKQTTLAGEIGAGEVFERLGTNDSSYTTLRLAERGEHKFEAHGARVWENVELLPEVSKPQNFIVNTEVGVESAVAKNLSLQIYVDDSYDSEPAGGSKKNDVKLVSGIKYKF